jgi:hypothetical protein
MLLLLTSCASRKVDVAKIEIKKDSVVEIKTSVVTKDSINKKDSTNIQTFINIDEIVLTPIDSTQPIKVGNVEYKNAVLRIKKTKSSTIYNNSKTESNIKRKDSSSVVSIHKKETIVGKTKAIDKEANYWFLFYWLILILIVYLLWKNKAKLLKLL